MNEITIDELERQGYDVGEDADAFDIQQSYEDRLIDQGDWEHDVERDLNDSLNN